jgi:mycoredoxin-dependent peroxiredoxin
MTEEPMPEIGEIAPDFTLLDQDKEPLTLSDLRGAPVMLVFFPGAFSSTCTRELCAIRDDFGAYEHRDVTVLGISVDSTHALRAWQQAQGYRNRFLSDRWPVGTVAKLYGVWNEGAGQADRGTFILDADGVVRYAVHNPSSQARDERAYVTALEAMAAGG